MICVNGLDYPVSHIKQLRELAQQAFNERNRNRKSIEKLYDLDFMDDKAAKKAPAQKQSTKLDALRKLMEK